MDNKFVSLDYLLNSSIIKDDISLQPNIENNINYFNDTKEKEKLNKMYQVIGNKNHGSAIIQYVGNAKERPAIILDEFDFKGYKCKIISYVLADSDIEQANDSCILKMIGLILEKNNNVIVCITLSFYTFNHKKDKKKIEEYISELQDNKLINGFFRFDIKYVGENNKIKTEIIGDIMHNYVGKTNSIYKLLELLSNDKLISILEYK